ncbi:MAG: thiamine phosphate synthase, partial [Kordiimonadaceae bacterium]|nr:thiamine phosphate synthase [Kordiimonadaceae bacterium]
YPTTTKIATSVAEPAILNWWQELFELPCVAIGGITVDNAAEMSAAGADFIAVCSGVWDYKDGPKAAVEIINQAIQS